jgi:hypothetical protein
MPATLWGVAQPLQLGLAANEHASDASAGRSAGAFTSRRRINASRSGGQCSLRSEGRTGAVLMCWLITAVASSPANGGLSASPAHSR